MFKKKAKQFEQKKMKNKNKKIYILSKLFKI